MCMHISTNYSAMFEQIRLFFGALMHPHVPHIVLRFQVNIFNSF